MYNKDTVKYIHFIKTKIDSDFRSIFKRFNKDIMDNYEIHDIVIYEDDNNLVVEEDGINIDNISNLKVKEAISERIIDILRKNSEISLVNIRRDMNPFLFKEDSESEKIKKVIYDFYRKKHCHAIISDMCIIGGIIEYYIIAIKKNFYDCNEKLFYMDNPLLDDSYNSFTIQVIDIIFDKWLSFSYYGYEESTVAYLQNEDSIINLAAEDMTSGRGIPSYKNYIDWSALTYEGSYCYGKIAICNHSDKQSGVIEFSSPIKIKKDNERYIRKLLELAKDEYYLFVTNNFGGIGERIWGLGKIRDLTGIHIVSFYGYMKWVLTYGNSEIVSFDKGNFVYQEDKEKEKDLKLVVEDLGFNIKKISKIIEYAIRQQHGALLVFSSDANGEVARLSHANRGIGIEPIDLYNNLDVILKLSSVDGAIILDGDGIAYGFGVILDGEAVAKGDNSRGSRFNSAKNYVELHNKKSMTCFSCVVSEDGSIDYLK